MRNISKLFTGHGPARGSGQAALKKIADRVHSGRKVFEISPVGSGRVRRLSNLTDRAVSSLSDPTREKPWHILSSRQEYLLIIASVRNTNDLEIELRFLQTRSTFFGLKRND